MARDESKREDLLREATALTERIELRIADESLTRLFPSSREAREHLPHVVVGFRANGSASFFFGDDPVYQFNADGELRRAYRQGVLFKASCGRLVALQRVRQQDTVQLLSRQMTDEEQASFVAEMQEMLRGLAGILEVGASDIVGQVPAGANVLSRVQNWLAAHTGLPIAATPRA